MTEYCLLFMMLIICVLVAINIIVLIRDRAISVNNVNVLTQANDVLQARNKVLQEKVTRATQTLDEMKSKVVAGILYASGEQLLLEQEDVALFFKIKQAKEDNLNG